MHFGRGVLVVGLFLAGIAAAAGSVIDGWFAAVGDEDPQVAQQAFAFLNAAPQLAAQLDSDPRAVEQATRLLKESLAWKDVRLSPIYKGLARLPRTLSAITPQIIEELHGTRSESSRISLVALLAASSSPLATEELIALLANGSENVRIAAASALGNSQSLSDAQLTAIAAHLRSPVEDVRLQAIVTLGFIDRPLPPHALAALLSTLNDPNESVRRQGIRAIETQVETGAVEWAHLEAVASNDARPLRPDECPIASGLAVEALKARLGVLKQGGCIPFSKDSIRVLLKVPRVDAAAAPYLYKLALEDSSRCDQVPQFAEFLLRAKPGDAVAQGISATLTQNASECGAADGDAIGRAFTALSNRGLSPAPTEVERLVELLSAKREVATRIFLAAPRLRRLARERLIRSLEGGTPTTRAAAYSVLVADSNSLAPDELRKVDELARRPEECCEALRLLGGSERGTEFVATVIGAGASSDLPQLLAVAEGLGAMRAPPAAYETLERLVRSDNVSVSVKAIGAVSQSAAAVRVMAPALSERLEDDDRAHYALQALALLDADARPYADKMVRLLSSRRMVGPADPLVSIVRAAPLEVEALVPILDLAASGDNVGRQRFAAHLLGGGTPPAEKLISWVGKPRTIHSTRDDEALALFATMLPVTRSHGQVRGEMIDGIERIASNTSWYSADLDLLERVERAMKAEGLNGAALTRARRLASARPIFEGLLAAWGGHFLLWMLLLFAYPRSLKVRTLFFWNPQVRQWGGLGYVQALLVVLPSFRRRLLQPFVPALREVSTIAGGSSSYYFPECMVRGERDGAAVERRVVDAIPSIRGHVLLEGESGLGKTVFVRRLFERRPDLPIAFLRADECHEGVLAALRKRLGGLGSDAELVEALVSSGGLEVCIDGLNEVSADTRAAVAEFVRSHPGTNILITTQPLMDWRAPVEVWRLQPLSDSQIETFLSARPSETDDRMGRSDYELACKEFLRRSLSADQPAEMRQALRLVLSNPMDLSVVADMIAGGGQPDLRRLQEQQVRAAALRYERVQARPFPLGALADKAYEMRLTDDAVLPEAELGPAIEAMQAEKLVLKRFSLLGTSSWSFRHDKIWEYFILQRFLRSGSDLPEKHLLDPRFRGVYYLLALTLPVAAAHQLRELLIRRAAETSDHSVSDRFVQLLASRQLDDGPAPDWSLGWRLPKQGERETRVQKLGKAHEAAAAELRAGEALLERARRLPRLLFEPHDLRASALVREAIAELGGETELLHEGASHFRAIFGSERSIWTVIVKSTAISRDDVSAALRAIRALLPDASEQIVVLTNVFPAVPPEARPPDLQDGVLEHLASEGVLCMRAVELLSRLRDGKTGVDAAIPRQASRGG